jgi:UvrD-like helicase family protein
MKTEIAVIYYNELNEHLINKKYARVLHQLQQGDFAGAEVKKMANSIYYRARLDDKDRLLFTWVEYHGLRHLLLLELITNHEYQKSRFLRGGLLPDESQWQPLKNDTSETVTKLTYLNEKDKRIHALNKFLSFDNDQADIYRHQPPMVLIGSAGSGKTVLVLEKIKQLSGHILYTSLSRYLVDNARSLYFANGYENEEQEIDFLSFNQYMATWQQPEGREVSFRLFSGWFQRHAHTMRFTDAHKLFEEFCGVITGQAIKNEYFTKDEYRGLGVRQSVYTADERTTVYMLFEKYVAWMKEEGYYDGNMLAHRFLPQVQQVYDYVVVDEVQDITNAQLQFILRSLISKNGFILTGDSNQIVHPNFFSWAAVKTFFYTGSQVSLPIHILHTNYRNSAKVVQLSNRLLLIKNLRFGSIDKESNYLVKTNSTQQGEVLLLQTNDKVQRDLNQRTVQSAGYAVIVPKDEDKAEAAKIFKTPLLFSVHEAKGLEYENVILFNFVSASSREFSAITEGIDTAALEVDSLTYARPADKSEKEGEVYKFFINSLYVALTRALSNIYMLEQQPNHYALQLLGLAEYKAPVNIQTHQSTKEEWLEEAKRLEEQGKTEQAEAIRAKVLGYEYLSPDELEQVKVLALDPAKKENEVKRERKLLYNYAVNNNRLDWVEQLANLQFQRAMLYMKEIRQVRKEYAKNCRLGRVQDILPVVKKYGPDFRIEEDAATGLMLALHYNQPGVAAKLLEMKARTDIGDRKRWGAFQYLLNGYLRTMIRKQPNLTNARLLVQFWYRVRPVFLQIFSDGQLKNLPGHRLYTLVFWLMQCFDEEKRDKIIFERNEEIRQLQQDGIKANQYQQELIRIELIKIRSHRENLEPVYHGEIRSDGVKSKIMELKLLEVELQAKLKEVQEAGKNLSLAKTKIAADSHTETINSPKEQMALGVFSIDDVMELVNCLPEEILPEEKRKRATVSGILSGHEENSNNPYNKRLFKRIDRGYYTLTQA